MLLLPEPNSRADGTQDVYTHLWSPGLFTPTIYCKCRVKFKKKNWCHENISEQIMFHIFSNFKSIQNHSLSLIFPKLFYYLIGVFPLMLCGVKICRIIILFTNVQYDCDAVALRVHLFYGQHCTTHVWQNMLLKRAMSVLSLHISSLWSFLVNVKSNDVWCSHHQLSVLVSFTQSSVSFLH